MADQLCNCLDNECHTNLPPGWACRKQALPTSKPVAPAIPQAHRDHDDAWSAYWRDLSKWQERELVRLHNQLLEHAEVCGESAYPISDRVALETNGHQRQTFTDHLRAAIRVLDDRSNSYSGPMSPDREVLLALVKYLEGSVRTYGSGGYVNPWEQSPEEPSESYVHNLIDCVSTLVVIDPYKAKCRVCYDFFDLPLDGPPSQVKAVEVRAFGTSIDPEKASGEHLAQALSGICPDCQQWQCVCVK